MHKLDHKQIKNILILAIPIILGNLSQMALNLIDSAMVSQISYFHLAAAALVNNIISFPFVMAMGFTVAISPLVAALRGAGKVRFCGSLLNNAVVLNTSLCLVVVSILYFCGDVIFHLKQDPEVSRLARPYLNWMLWSIVPMIVFLSIKQFCDGLNHTKVPMILALSSIPLNALLNYFFIFGTYGFPRLELEGAGIATFITRMVIAILIGAYVLLHSKYQIYGLENRRILKSKLGKILKLALPSSWQYCSEIGAFVVLGIMVGWFGAIQQAAHQISLSVASLTFMVSIGLSTAGSIKVGEAYGMQDRPLARNIGITILKMAFIYGLVCALIFILFKDHIPLIFSSEPEVIRHAAFLFYLAAAFQLGDSLQAVGIGILRGIQDVKAPTLYTTLCYWFLGIPAGYFFSVWLKMEVVGIWIGFIICLSIMGILLLRRFLKITHLAISNNPL
ncbi:MAG: MATE family efflux transporter [Saprospiraceae bacterium]|nr:MATE family efflux transporter [Saprospiraceae bacterium]